MPDARENTFTADVLYVATVADNNRRWRVDISASTTRVRLLKKASVFGPLVHKTLTPFSSVSARNILLFRKGFFLDILQTVKNGWYNNKNVNAKISWCPVLEKSTTTSSDGKTPNRQILIQNENPSA